MGTQKLLLPTLPLPAVLPPAELEQPPAVETIRVLHVINGEYYAGAERVQDLLAKRLPEGVDFIKVDIPVNATPQTRWLAVRTLATMPGALAALRDRARLAVGCSGGPASAPNPVTASAWPRWVWTAPSHR